MKVKIVLKNGKDLRDTLPIKSFNEISKFIHKCKWINTGKFLICVDEIAYIEHDIRGYNFSNER